MAKKKPLSVWRVLARLGHTGVDSPDGRENIIQHVFEATSRVTLWSHDGRPLYGDDFLCSVFDALGSTPSHPRVGSDVWLRLRLDALRRVVARLAREGLLDWIAVAPASKAVSKD